jgi:hypothetical protein
LLGELHNTPYGNLAVNYTGVDPKYLALPPKSYELFGRWRGHVGDEQIALAHEVWKADARELNRLAGQTDSDSLSIQGQSLVDVCSLELAPNTAYQLQLEASSRSEWEVVVIDAHTGASIKQTDISGSRRPQQTAELFRTLGTSRVRVALRPSNKDSNDPIRLYEMKVLEVAHL